jgi:hypothetical protein
VLARDVPDFTPAVPLIDAGQELPSPSRRALFERIDELRPFVAEYERLLSLLESDHEASAGADRDDQ